MNEEAEYYGDLSSNNKSTSIYIYICYIYYNNIYLYTILLYIHLSIEQHICCLFYIPRIYYYFQHQNLHFFVSIYLVYIYIYILQSETIIHLHKYDSGRALQRKYNSNDPEQTQKGSGVTKIMFTSFALIHLYYDTISHNGLSGWPIK